MFGAAQVMSQTQIDNFRPVTQDGVNMFETPKEDSSEEVTQPRVKVGGAFTQQFQSLDHSTSFTTDDPTGELVQLRPGFNNATANFNIDVQLDDGVRMELVTYLSSRHHTEAWVKGGYIQFDKLPFIKSEGVEKLMEYMTIKIGHMEINYGDGHFRRSDNGNAIYNPFVGNYIMDAFDTQIGGEVYFRSNGILAMVALTDGEIKGSVRGESNPAFYGKFGYDKQINDDFRFRLMGSLYTTNDEDNRNNLYSGDRAGARYYDVMDTNASSSFRSGRWNPGFATKVTSLQFTPFVKYSGLEFFGIYEISNGYNGTETERQVNQLSGEVIYRFLENEQLFVGARYNQVSGELATGLTDATIDRLQIGAGWFLTKNILAKVEYVKHNYNDFTGSVYQNGQFDGLMLEAVIGF